MIYLDYAANTPVDMEVLDTFYDATIKYVGNPNSPHDLGTMASERLNQSTKKIAKLLHGKENEVIYTSGASESNNMAIKGVAHNYKRYGSHIITTFLEHASVTGPFTALQNEGFEIDFVNITPEGQVDLKHLKELLREDTILVSVCYIDSEIGTIQPLVEIYQLVKEQSHCYFHVDATQAIGKIPVTFECMDLMTLSAHKFYGMNGSGVLLKKESVFLEPLIHGGLSTTTFRSGTPTVALVVSTEKAMELAIEHQLERNNYVRGLKESLTVFFEPIPDIRINSPKTGSPFILNLSIKGVNTNRLQQELNKKEIYVATKSACCAPNTVSKPVYALTKDRKMSLNTLRISLSHRTTQEEIEKFKVQFIESLDCVKNSTP